MEIGLLMTAPAAGSLANLYPFVPVNSLWVLSGQSFRRSSGTLLFLSGAVTEMAKDTPWAGSQIFSIAPYLDDRRAVRTTGICSDDEKLELVGPPSSCSEGEMARKSAKVKEREDYGMARITDNGPKPSGCTSSVLYCMYDRW